MPVYPYECSACGHAFDEIQTMAEPPLAECPACKEPALKRLFGVPSAVVAGNPRTLGTLAEQNTARLVRDHGREAAERIVHESVYGPGGRKLRTPKGAKVFEKTGEKPDRPWWRTGEVEGVPALDKPLDTRQVKNVEKYVMTGEKE